MQKERYVNEYKVRKIERHNALVKRVKELMEQGYTAKEIASILKTKESVVRVLASEDKE